MKYYHSLLFGITISTLSCLPASFSETENDVTPMTMEELTSVVELSLSISHHYFAVCAVLLHPYKTKYLPNEVFAFMKMLTTSLNHNMCSATRNFADYAHYVSSQVYEKCSRTINIIFGEDHLIRLPFIKLTHQVAMAGPLWLVILNQKTNIQAFFEGGNLPFDVDLVIAQRHDGGFVDLHEAYRTSLSHPIRISHYGNWTLSTGLTTPSHVSLYYRRNDFEGLQFKVACSESFPVVRVLKKDGKISIDGYFASVWKELGIRLNFSSNYILTEGGSGMLNNGRWSGVTGAVSNGEADVGIAALTITPDRYSYVDFLRPLITTRNNLIFQNSGSEIRWSAIFRPFGTNVWLSLLMWIVCASVFLRFCIFIGIMNNFEPQTILPDFTLLNSFFCLLRAFSQQATPVVPASLPSRIILITSYFASVVMLTAYSGALISFIAVQIPRLPFKNLMDMVDQGSYALQVVKNSAAYMTFANATVAVQKNAFRLMAPDLPRTVEEGLARLCKHAKLAHFGPQAVMDSIVQRLNLQGCNIMSLPHPLNSVYLSVIIQRKSQYKDALNHHLDMMIYQGLLGRLRKQLWPVLGSFSPEVTIEVKTEQVVPIYMVLIVGITVAAIILMVEVCKKRRRNLFMNNIIE